MRHNKKTKYLGRNAAHRGAMLSNMASSLILHKRIFTTVPKAKALRTYVEPIITRSKEDTLHSRREVFSMLQSKQAVTELFQNVSQKVADRPGGYTRIIKTGFRLGDNAAMCFIELVDYNENMLETTRTRRSKTRRSRRKSRSAAAATTAAATTATAAAVETDASDEVKKESSSKKEAPVKEEAPAKEEAPVKEEAPAKEEAPKKEEASAKEETKTDVKDTGEEKPESEGDAKA